MRVDAEVLFVQALQHGAQTSVMIVARAVEDADNAGVGDATCTAREYLTHEPLEDRGCIGQSNREARVLEQASRREGNFQRAALGPLLGLSC